MKTLLSCIFVSAGLLASAGSALASEALAKKYNCLSCHGIDKKVIGPAYTDVAAKYKGDAGASAKIVGELKSGKGHPVKVNASDEDLKTLADYVLTVK